MLFTAGIILLAVFGTEMSSTQASQIVDAAYFNGKVTNVCGNYGDCWQSFLAEKNGTVEELQTSVCNTAGDANRGSVEIYEGDCASSGTCYSDGGPELLGKSTSAATYCGDINDLSNGRFFFESGAVKLVAGVTYTFRIVDVTGYTNLAWNRENYPHGRDFHPTVNGSSEGDVPFRVMVLEDLVVTKVPTASPSEACPYTTWMCGDGSIMERDPGSECVYPSCPGKEDYGTCGSGNVGNGVCADGLCCSRFGWCDFSDAHCGHGTCGDGSRGNGVCPSGECCSSQGYCGNTDGHCGATLSPSQAPTLEPSTAPSPEPSKVPTPTPSKVSAPTSVPTPAPAKTVDAAYFNGKVTNVCGNDGDCWQSFLAEKNGTVEELQTSVCNTAGDANRGSVEIYEGDCASSGTCYSDGGPELLGKSTSAATYCGDINDLSDGRFFFESGAVKLVAGVTYTFRIVDVTGYTNLAWNRENYPHGRDFHPTVNGSSEGDVPFRVMVLEDLVVTKVPTASPSEACPYTTWMCGDGSTMERDPGSECVYPSCPGKEDYGTCGSGNVGNGVCADGLCCSRFGWCDFSDAHCGHGTCGDGSRGNGVCPSGECCSSQGYCGNTDGHCGATLSPSQAPTLAPSTAPSPEPSEACPYTTWMCGDGSTMERDPGSECVYPSCPGKEDYGTCGSGNVGNGVCADGLCCSRFGWCDFSDAHCGHGTCGDGSRGNGVCPNGQCCSASGWCGTSNAHCQRGSWWWWGW